MALPNYAKMFPKQPTGTVPAGVSPSAWALNQSQANQAAAKSKGAQWQLGHIEKGIPSHLVQAMDSSDPVIRAAATAKYRSMYPMGPDLSGAAGNLPYLDQRAYDAMRHNELATAGLDLQGNIPTPLIGGIAGAGEPFVPLSAQGNIEGYQNRYDPPTTGMTGGAGGISQAVINPGTISNGVPPPTTIIRDEDDPTGSLWDAFQRSLNQAEMPAQFRATWG